MNELRPCGRPGCRLCNPLPAEPNHETLAELLLATVFIVGIAFLFALLPVLVL